MMYDVTVAVVAYTCMIFSTLAFFPNRLTDLDLGEGTLTHQDITELGVLQAVALFFEENPKPGSSLEPGQLSQMTDITVQKLFQAYHGEEATGIQLQNTIDDIVAGNNIIYKDYFDRAVSHHNGETIREANEEMIEIREDIISVLNTSTANFDLASELIGQYLHMLQMFYSNTNWVELFGSDVYHSLGIRGKPILQQAPSIMSTCVSCSENCEDNLIGGDDILTSGYRSGQTPEKPYKDPLEFESGKCSHGGVFDTSGESSAALGGINKDATLISLSPHHHLHNEAAQAAIKHTTEFFNNKGYGLRYMIGEDKYQQYLQLRSGTSLVFAIDYTTSMSDDIVAVKEQVSAILLETLDTVHQPANFILALFSEPVALNKVFISEDGYETLEYLQSIKLAGGSTDCPEPTMAGLEMALSVCNPNSKMYVFTDADAKDEDRSDFVRSLAERKNVELDFFLTGTCANSLGRKRRDTQNNFDDIYQTLAATSGGHVYVTDKTGIVKATNVIKDPTPGVWTLNVKDTDDVALEVSAQTALDVTSYFVQTDPRTGFQYQIIGRPVSGDNATVVVYVPSKDLVTTVDMIQLLDTDGSQIASHGNFQDIASRADTGLYRVNFPLPTQEFQISISGEDKSGNRFTRVHGKPIVPVSIELSVQPINETLYINETITVNFVVVNKGANTADIIVNIKDDRGFAQAPTQHTFTLDPSGNDTDSFLLKSGPMTEITTVTVSARAASSVGDDSQFVIKRIASKERIIRPKDNTNPETGSCDDTKVDPCSCTKHMWTGSVSILDEGFGLFRISSSLRGGSLVHGNFTYGYSGAVEAEVKADCCTPRVYITAVDMASNTGACVLDLAPEVSLPIPECPATTPIPTSQSAVVSISVLLMIAAVVTTTFGG